LLDLTRTPDTVLAPNRHRPENCTRAGGGLAPDDVMVVGACCRGILHGVLGHTFPNTGTGDLDLALALSSW
jgi:hypothetical protein